MDERERLIVEQIPHLRRYALALLGDRDRANDLVQDCLERGLSRWHLWRPGNLRAWLFTIMHNINANARRRAARAPAVIPIEVAEFAAPVPPAQEDALNLAALQRALAALPEEQRAVLLLVGLEGFAYAEAAKILSIPIGTVMSRLHRGREQLRRQLDAMGSGGAGPSLRRVK